MDRLELFAQQEFAFPLANTGLGALAYVMGYLHYLDAMRQQVKQPIQAVLEVNVLQQRLFLLRLDIDIPRNQIGQKARCIGGLDGIDHFLRNLRKQPQRLDGALLELQVARLKLRIALGNGLVHTLDPGHHKWVACEVFQCTKALLSLADDVALTVGRGDVTQNRGDGADAR